MAEGRRKTRRPALLSSKTANWLHLERLRPLDDGRIEDGEFIVTCATPDDLIVLPAVCCTAPHLKRNGTKIIRARHRRLQPMATWLEIPKQRFQCRTCGSTSYEVLTDIDEDHRMSRDLEHEVYMSAIKRTFEDAAIFHQVKKDMVRRIFLKKGAEALAGYEIRLPKVLGVDENRILSGDRFICADVDGGKILDLLPSRDVPQLMEYFGRVPYRFDVEVFCQDMWRGYETVATKLFPQATIVIDRFHVVRYANDAFDNARRVFQVHLSNEDRIWLKGKRKLLLSRWDKIDVKAQDKTAEITARYPEIGDAYIWKEKFFDLYDLTDRQTAEEAFEAWDETMPKHLARFFRPVSRMVRNWRKPIFNFYDARYTNGMVENLNGRINSINRKGFGYSFEVLRMKALLRYGNIIPLGDLVAFDRTSGDDAEGEALERIPVIHGFDPATLEEALEKGCF